MSYTPFLENAKESIVRSYTGTGGWLSKIENVSPSMDDAEIQVGTNLITIMDTPTPVAVSNKTSTAVIADKGTSHTASATTVYYYSPIKFFDYELKRMERTGVLMSELDKYYRLAADAVYATVAKTIVDALSDGTISITNTLSDGNTNFAAADLANQALNLAKLGNSFGQVSAQNNGMLPDWVIAQTTAFGNLTGYSNQNTTAIQQTNGNGYSFSFRGVPVYAQGNGTSAKWGAASKACIFIGTNRSIVYRLNRVSVASDISFESATGLWTLPVGFTYTYCVDFTTTTGLARSVGEVINGVS